jgi:Holliday junction resolvase
MPNAKKEKPFETQIRKFLEAEGCYCFKVWGGGYQQAGIPDLLICVNGYFVAVEVKGDTGKPSELQLHNIEKIKKSGGVAMVLYPKGFQEFKNLIYKLKGR